MKTYPATAANRRSLKAARRAGPTARAASCARRQHQIRKAVTDVDREYASRVAAEVVSECLSKKVKAFDEISALAVHGEYGQLDALEATHRFAEQYFVVVSAPGWPWSVPHEATVGLAGSSLPNLRHFWMGRLQADLLGMEYGLYIGAIAASHAARGFTDAPLPVDLQGRAASATAGLAKALSDAQDVAERDEA